MRPWVCAHNSAKDTVLAFPTRGRFIAGTPQASLADPMAPSPAAPAEAADELASMGVIRLLHDGDETKVSLRLDSAMVNANLRVGGAIAMRRVGFGARLMKSFSKLEMLQYLLMRGWSSTDDEFLVRDGAGSKQFSKTAMYMPLSYLRVLAISHAVFLKPGGCNESGTEAKTGTTRCCCNCQTYQVSVTF